MKRTVTRSFPTGRCISERFGFIVEAADIFRRSLQYEEVLCPCHSGCESGLKKVSGLSSKQEKESTGREQSGGEEHILAPGYKKHPGFLQDALFLCDLFRWLLPETDGFLKSHPSCLPSVPGYPGHSEDPESICPTHRRTSPTAMMCRP